MPSAKHQDPQLLLARNNPSFLAKDFPIICSLLRSSSRKLFKRSLPTSPKKKVEHRTSRPTTVYEPSPLMQDLVTNLSELGAAGYPARVLTALIENPGASASQLCKLTGIPDSKIYQALDDLERKWNLIHVSRGNPSMYRALDPDQIVDSLKKNAEKEHAEKLKTLASVKRSIEPLAKRAATPGELEIAYIVKGRPNVIQRLRSAIEDSKKQILFLTFDKDLLEAVHPALLEARARKWKIRSGVTPELVETAETMGHVKELICKCNLLLSDDSKLVTVSNWGSDKCHAIVSDDPVMTTIAREYYDNPKCCC